MVETPKIKSLEELLSVLPNIIQSSWQEYLNFLYSTELLTEDEIVLVKQIFQEYLSILHAENRLADAIYLLPPQINPHTYIHNGEPLIKLWEQEHLNLHTALADQDAQMVSLNDGGFFVNLGPMYTGKTAAMLIFYQKFHSAFPQGFVEAFVADSMLEREIRSRISEGAMQVTMTIPAEKITGDGLLSRLREIAYENEKKGPGIILIDEITFMLDNEQTATFISLVRDLNKKGITVYCAGLNANYLNESLPFASFLEENTLPGDSNNRKFEPFYPVYEKGVCVGYGNEPCGTGRYVEIANGCGFFDLLTRVIVARSDNIRMEYAPIPLNSHIFNVLKQKSPEYYLKIMELREEVSEKMFNKMKQTIAES